MNTSNRLITVALSLLFISSASARPWYIEPQLELSAGYDDNPGLETVSISDSETDSSIDTSSLISDGGPLAYIGGEIRLGSETESDLIAFDFAALARRYNNAPELDSEYLLASALYQKTSLRHDYGFEVGATKDSTLETELLDTGRFNQDVDRQEIFIRPTLTSRFSQLWMGDFELGYSDISYDERTNSDGSSLFVDYEDVSGSAQIDRILSDRLQVFGLAEFLLYRPTEVVGLIGVERDDFAGIQLGFEYDINELLLFTISAGRGYTKTDLAEVEETIKHNSPIYNASMEYAGERTGFAFDYSRTFESSGGGSLTLTETFSFSLSRPETFGGLLSFPISYIVRDPERAESVGIEAETRDYFELAPRISWDLTQQLTISAEIRYRDQELGTTSSDLTSHVTSTAAILGLNYDFGQKRISY